MEQMPHHREGIQNELDKAYDEGHIDNELIDEEYKTLDYNNSAVNMSKRILAELKGDNVTEEGVVNETSPELTETIARIRDAGYLDTSFEGKESHTLTMRALSKEEAITEYKTRGSESSFWGDLDRVPYTTLKAEKLDVMMMNFGKSISTDKAEAEMNKLGVRPLTYEELIQYGIAYPTHQKQNSIAALGSVYPGANYTLAPYLGFDGALYSHPLRDHWRDDFRFPVVHK